MRKIEIVLVTLFALLFLSFIALAVDCPIPDTGQTKCYDNDSEITCPQSGEPFYGQDAQYPCNPHSYTSLSGGIMVQDNVTGLIWENKTDDGSIHDKDNGYTWDDAQDVFIAALNNDHFGGYSDWRLPTIMELSFLVDRNRYGPSINTTYFPNTESSYYWSSTTYADDPYRAWSVGFGSGYVDDDDKSDGYYVRAVRGGQCGALDTSTTTTVASTTTTISSSTTTTISGSTTTTTIGYDPDCIEKWSTEFVISNTQIEDYFCFSPFDSVCRCDSINCNVKCGSSMSWTINLILVRVFEYWSNEELCNSGIYVDELIGYNGFLFPLIGVGFGTFHYAYIEVPVVFRRIWW